MHNHILKPILSAGAKSDITLDSLLEGEQLAAYGAKIIHRLEDGLYKILEGSVLLLFDGDVRTIAVPLQKVQTRSIDEPKNESVVLGPREAFIEDLNTNLTMIRRRIKSASLKAEKHVFGRISHTSLSITYIEGICEPKLLDEVKKRLSRIDVDSLSTSNMVEEFIEDSPYSFFPQVQYTERPDTYTAALLEGRVGIIVDGNPVTLVVPATFYMLMQSAEDYNQRYMFATWIRWIRLLYLLISFLLPSLYIAITTFHPEMIPTSLLITVAASREIVPFPAIVEAFIMEITFEALREASIRTPQPIGLTLSIIGALVIGQAAVQAGIVSAPMVIIVSLTGIASFMIPNYSLGLTFRLLRFPIMLLAGTLGLIGITVGIYLIYMHMLSLRSFGTAYLSPTAPLQSKDLKDSLVRAPWWRMWTRPKLYGTRGSTRMARIKRPHVPEEDED